MRYIMSLWSTRRSLMFSSSSRSDKKGWGFCKGRCASLCLADAWLNNHRRGGLMVHTFLNPPFATSKAAFGGNWRQPQGIGVYRRIGLPSVKTVNFVLFGKILNASTWHSKSKNYHTSWRVESQKAGSLSAPIFTPLVDVTVVSFLRKTQGYDLIGCSIQSWVHTWTRRAVSGVDPALNILFWTASFFTSKYLRLNQNKKKY